MGVTVKFLPPYEPPRGAQGIDWDFNVREPQSVHARKAKSEKAWKAGHAVYQDRQGALIEALCECAFEDEPNYKRIDRGMDTAFVAEHGFHCEKKPIRLRRTPQPLGNAE